MKDRYIIVELIPEAISPDKGSIVQLSAIKLNGLVLEDRFDYRLKEDNIKIKDLLKIISYDKELFKYVDTSEEIINEFKNWSEDLKLLIIDNEYTKNYLKGLNNEKESILKYLNLEYSDDVIEKIIDKYKLEQTNYIVDLLYEALIYNDNN